MLPQIDYAKIKERERVAIQKMEKAMERIGVGVTPEAQRIFDFMAKTMPCRWEGKTIVVLDDVRESKQKANERTIRALRDLAQALLLLSLSFEREMSIRSCIFCGQVRITEPYKPDNCTGSPGTRDHVLKLVSCGCHSRSLLSPLFVCLVGMVIH